jgi:SAM-dependent methyltransferase
MAMTMEELMHSFKVLMMEVTEFDNKFLDENIQPPENVNHSNYMNHLVQLANKQEFNVLEIGSREVTGVSTARNRFDKANYIGFDYYPGNNVDIVGDAHKLSSYFNADERFDLIYSSACFEHFAMPWVVAIEIAKLLKIGGYVFIETHFSYSVHERPWHFFQFSDMALKVLFSKALGFECIETGMCNPIVGRFSTFADEYLKQKPVKGLYCHSEYLGKKISDVNDFMWENTNVDEIVDGTTYPLLQ